MQVIGKLWFLGVMAMWGLLAGTAVAEEPQKLGLWNGRAALGAGQTEDQEVWITVYRAAQPNGTAVVICPGGGYGGLAVQPEGHGIARWLNGHGVTGVVLEYRMPAGRHAVPLLDVQRAIRTVRARAGDWAVQPNRIGVIGFSAGGHLASTASTHFDAGMPDAADVVDRVSCRPDFSILIYPVISMGASGHGGSRHNLMGKEPSAELIERYSNETQVTPQTPPAFLAHALDDEVVVPKNSQLYYDALRAKGVAAEYLILPSGGHGLSGYKGPSWDAWQMRSITWLQEQKLLAK